MSVSINYPAKRAVQTITNAEFDLIERSGKNMDYRIHCIKFIRQQYSIGLYEAKMICDTIWNEPNQCAQSANFSQFPIQS